MENAIIVPFDLNTARKIKSGEIEGSVLIDNIEIEFVYESNAHTGRSLSDLIMTAELSNIAKNCKI